MRREIFGASNLDLYGEATADAGSDQSERFISSFSNLDGTGSSTTGGTVDSYLWEVISGTGIVIDTPTSSTSTLSGTNIVGDTVIQLTITDTNGNTDTDTVTLTIEAVPPLVIEATPKDTITLQGQLNISDGIAGEIIELSFTMNYGNNPDNITFSGGIMSGVLDYQKTTAVGSITLDGSGNGTSTYTAYGTNYNVQVAVVGRSSIYPIPEEDNAVIYVYS
jgi:hypothetical protein